MVRLARGGSSCKVLPLGMTRDAMLQQHNFIGILHNAQKAASGCDMAAYLGKYQVKPEALEG